MMPMYQNEDFDKSVLPTHLKKDAQDIIVTAVAFGWRLHVTGQGGCTIIAPDDRKKYHFGGSGRATINHNRIKRDLVRFGDPELVALARVGIATPEEGVPEQAADLAFAAVPRVGDKGTIVMDRNEDQPQPEPRSVTEPTIVSEKPMLAKRDQNRAYESEVTIERRWSDGTVDYKCVTCDYTSPHRLSVGRHSGAAHGKISDPNRPGFKADVSGAASYRPQQRRVEALAEVVARMLATGEYDAEQIARECLFWVHQQSHQGTDLAAEREELTDTDILNRIRNLLDDGSHGALHRQVEAQAEQLAALTTRLEQTETYAAEQAQRAEEARQTLYAFRDLVTEQVQEEGRSVG